jgi:carbamoyltransferase
MDDLASRFILALGGSDHDVNACLMDRGNVLVNIEEERLCRKKYGLGGNLLEGRGWRYCLEAVGGLSLADIDRVLADSILAPSAVYACKRDAERFDHHLLHAASSFFTSPFDRAAVLVVDNAGDLYRDADGIERLQATSWFLAEGNSIELLGRVGSADWIEGPLVRGRPYQRGDGDDSLGHFYKKVTGALGFRYPPGSVLSDYFFPEDGITMGLASYGDGRHVEELWTLARLGEGGAYRLSLKDGRLDEMLQRWLEGNADFDTRAAIAAAAQEVLTRILCHVVEHIIEVTQEDRLCLSGGVAMNSAANGEILRRTRVRSLYVPPTPGDNGTAVGAAMLAASLSPGRRPPGYSVYGGRCYGEEEIDAALQQLAGTGHTTRRLDDASLLAEVAQRLADGQVVAWFEGGSESGRRALGHRSLLADPRRAEMRDHLNLKVKRRQFFRPFAPVVQEHRASEFFEMNQSSPYMQIVFQVREQHRATLAAVTHVDGTARPQTVREEQHPRWYRLLDAFGALTGVPVLVNTSFNLGGEPLVETPAEAVSAYLRTGVEALVIENRLTVRP